MKLRRALVGVVVLLASTPQISVAQQEPSDVSWTLGTRAWVTTGYTTWSFEGAGIKPISELRWRGVDSVVPEVSGELLWKRLVLVGSVGGGSIDEGVLIDDDFGSSNHEARFSHTRSDVRDESLSYVNADVGVRVLALPATGKSPPGYLDYFIGYQYWHEEYVALGLTGVCDQSFGITGLCGTFGLPIVLGISAPSNVKVITHDYFWQSLRVGLRTQIPLSWGLALKARVVVLPWSSSELKDVHHLRSDLKQNPSFSSEAEGGFGVQLDGGLTYTWWKGLSIEAGYQHWGLDSGKGDKFTRAGGGTTRDTLDQIRIERYGPYLGLQYRF